MVLNKTDLLPEASREEKIQKMKTKLANTLKATKFSGCTMVRQSSAAGMIVAVVSVYLFGIGIGPWRASDRLSPRPVSYIEPFTCCLGGGICAPRRCRGGGCAAGASATDG